MDDFSIVPLDDIHADEHLKYEEKPVVILDKKTKTLHNKVIGLVKPQWKHRKGSKWTWEPKEEMRSNYQNLFS